MYLVSIKLKIFSPQHIFYQIGQGKYTNNLCVVETKTIAPIEQYK